MVTAIEQPLKHGGDLERAEREFGIAIDQWLDLSTGISPWSWPIPAVPEAVWRTLPDSGRQLAIAAADYYGVAADTIQPVAGSQIAIECLPTLLATGSVALPVWGYAEHQRAWQRAGHRLHQYHSAEQLRELVETETVNYAVVINPNNPTGQLLPPDWLLSLHGQLAERDGCLLVDEAFMDTSPTQSLLPHSPQQGLVVLRSLGKFFGLAGLRVGFAVAEPALLQRLAATLPPWLISHPSNWLAQQALRDTDWQQQQLARLQQQAASWQQFLREQLPQLAFTHAESPLFISGFADDAICQSLYRKLAEQGVLVRIFESRLSPMCEQKAGEPQNALRFGLPTAADRPKAEAAVLAATNTVIKTETSLCV